MDTNNDYCFVLTDRLGFAVPDCACRLRPACFEACTVSFDSSLRSLAHTCGVSRALYGEVRVRITLFLSHLQSARRHVSALPDIEQV